MSRYDVFSSATERTVLRVLPPLAEEIGLNASLVLLQIVFWIRISDHVHDGRSWTFQSLRDMQRKAFPFWSHMTIQRAIEQLVSRDLLFIRDDLNRLKYDHTRWFAINPDGFRRLESVILVEISARGERAAGVYQVETGLSQVVTGAAQDVTPIPETTPETTPERAHRPLAPDLSPGPAEPEEPVRRDSRRTEQARELIRTYLRALGIHDPAACAVVHKSSLQHALALLRMGAGPDDLAQLIEAKQKQGKTADSLPMRFLVEDYALRTGGPTGRFMIVPVFEDEQDWKGRLI